MSTNSITFGQKIINALKLKDNSTSSIFIFIGACIIVLIIVSICILCIVLFRKKYKIHQKHQKTISENIQIEMNINKMHQKHDYFALNFWENISNILFSKNDKKSNKTESNDIRGGMVIIKETETMDEYVREFGGKRCYIPVTKLFLKDVLRVNNSYTLLQNGYIFSTQISIFVPKVQQFIKAKIRENKLILLWKQNNTIMLNNIGVDSYDSMSERLKSLQFESANLSSEYTYIMVNIYIILY